MKKKRRNPRPERSAFESARAALERAGEEYPPATEEDAPGTPEPSEASEAPETLDTPAFATVEDMEEPEAVEDADDAEAEAPEMTDSADTETVESTDDADGETPEGTDNADAETVENTDAADAEAVESTDTVEPEAVESTDSVEAVVESTDNAEAEVVENTDSAETQAPESTDNTEKEVVESADAAEAQSPESADAAETETPADTEQAAAFVQPDIVAEEVPDADAAFSEESADAPSDEPEAVEDTDAESAWDVDYEPFPGMESEVTDTERHTMETREITLGYKGPDADKPESDEAESGKKSEKRGKKPRFNPLERLKAAVQEYANREKADKEPDDIPPSAVSKDAAIRKRVMQITDEETRNYLLDRVLPQMTWYGRKSAQYQKMYYRFMVATIVLGALIPISALLAHLIVAALLGASVTAINAYLALRKYQELWVSYRNVREDLLHTLYCYFNRAGVFAKKDSTQEELDVLLVDTCENAFSKENGGWSTTMQKTL